MGLFDFYSMADNYEQRKVDRFERGRLVIDTAAVTDSSKPYETGICHPSYNHGSWVIVELYDTKEEAQQGHNKWVKTMTTKPLPKQLKDISTAEVAKLIDIFGEDWREKPKKKKKI